MDLLTNPSKQKSIELRTSPARAEILTKAALEFVDSMTIAVYPPSDEIGVEIFARTSAQTCRDFYEASHGQFGRNPATIEEEKALVISSALATGEVLVVIECHQEQILDYWQKVRDITVPESNLSS